MDDRAITCIRCGKESMTRRGHLPHEYDAEGEIVFPTWTGSVDEAICPGCQYAEMHPHCTSIRAESGYGERIDFAALTRGERVVVQTGTLDGDDVPRRADVDERARGARRRVV